MMRMAQNPMTVRNRPIVLRIDQLSSKYAGTMSVAAARASWDERFKVKRAQVKRIRGKGSSKVGEVRMAQTLRVKTAAILGSKDSC